VPSLITDSGCIDTHPDGRCHPDGDAHNYSSPIGKAQKKESEQNAEKHDGTPETDPESQPIKGIVFHLFYCDLVSTFLPNV
jgi:hypothetical protein